MHLQWTDNSTNETRFVLDVGDRPGGVRFPSAYSNEYYVYAPTTIEEFVEYCFLVKAENVVGSSAWSNQACVTPLPAPAAPSSLTATATSSSTILLTWNDNSNVEETFILWRQNHLPPVYPSANATSYEWGGLAPNTQYCFRVQARNASWTSGAAPGGWTFLCATTLA
jgi:titin